MRILLLSCYLVARAQVEAAREQLEAVDEVVGSAAGPRASARARLSVHGVVIPRVRVPVCGSSPELCWSEAWYSGARGREPEVRWFGSPPEMVGWTEWRPQGCPGVREMAWLRLDSPLLQP